MNIKTKIITALILTAVVLPGISLAQTTTPTIASIQAEIQSLLAELQTLELQAGGKVMNTSSSVSVGVVVSSSTSTPPSTIVNGGSASSNGSGCYTFSSNLGIGSAGSAVQTLQNALQNEGFSVGATGSYNQQTAAAVSAFQEKFASNILVPSGLTTGTGYVGAATRAELNALFGCGIVQNPIVVNTSTPCVIAPGSKISCAMPPVLPILPPATSTLPCTVAVSGSSVLCLPPSIPRTTSTVICNPNGLSACPPQALGISAAILGIISPTSGATLTQGSQFIIQWNPNGDASPAVNINLFKNGSGILNIARAANTGSYVWTVPYNYSGTGFSIQIQGNTEATSSAQFSIVAG